jgi:outer membrane biosynthesis protein TonB
MKSRRIPRTGITASAIAHLSALALLLFFTEVHPFGSVTAEPITVDLVPAAEVAPPRKEEPVPEPKEKPPDAFDLSSKAAAPPQAPTPAAAPPPPPTRPQQQAAMQPPSPATQPGTPQPQPPAESPTPSYVPPEPDLSIKYHVMLGLPPELPAEPVKDKSGDFDAQASKAADIASSLVAEFRRHLRSCSKLPASIVASDNLKITLRVMLTLQGKLVADPILVEASASAKGPALMQGAVAALRDCQPYAMLPADRYGEWKVLDLTFTPQDFSS